MITSYVFTFISFTYTVFPVSVASDFTGYPGIHNCSIPGVVALTFDDGPSPNGGTQSVLDVLREEGVKATFFVTGQGHDRTFLDTDESKKNLLRQIYKEGHQIGSHTWSHSNLIRNRTKEQILQDITHLATTVYNILGIKMTVLRPPYGYTNETVVKLIQDEFGYQIIRWNLDTKDWYYGKNIDISFKEYERKVNLSSNPETSFISLHHDPVARSGELAKKSIEFVKSKGFRLVTVGECIGVPDHAD